MWRPLLFCLISISFYIVFIRYHSYSHNYRIFNRYLYPKYRKSAGEMNTNDSSQIVDKEKSSVVSKFGLDFELFYNVRNALRIPE